MASSFNARDYLQSQGNRTRDRSMSMSRRDSQSRKQSPMPAVRPRKSSSTAKYYLDDDDARQPGMLDDDPRLAGPPSRRDKSRSRTRYNNSHTNNDDDSDDGDESADEDMYRRLGKDKGHKQPSYGRYYLSDEEDLPSPSYAPAPPPMRRSKSSGGGGGGGHPSKGYGYASADALGYDSERERGRRARMMKPEVPPPSKSASKYRQYTQPVMDTDEEDDDDEDDDDEVLRYGGGGYYGYPSRRNRSASRGNARYGNKPSLRGNNNNIYYVEEDDSEDSPDYYNRRSRRGSRSASRSRTRADEAAHHYDTATALAAAASTTRNQADYDKYVRQLRKLDPKARSRSRSKPRSKSVAGVVPPAPEFDDDWAEVPECERPDFVPPPQHPEPTPVGVGVHPQQQHQQQQQRAPHPGGLGMYASQPPPAPSPTTPTARHHPYNHSSVYAQGNNQHPRRQSQPQPQQHQVPPPPPPPPPPPAAPAPGANPAMQQYPSVPRAQYLHQQHPQYQQHPQQTVPDAHYAHPQAAPHNRAPSSTGPPTSPQRQYASPPAYQYRQVNPDLKYTSNPAKPSLPSENRFSAKAAAPAAPTAPTVSPAQTPTQVPDLSHFLEPKPRRRRPSIGRPHSYSFPSPPSREQMNVPGSFPDPAPPPGSPLVEPYKGTAQHQQHQQHQQQQQQQKAAGSTSRWSGAFAKYFAGNDDEKAAPTSEPKRSNSKATKKKATDKDKLDRWVKLSRNTAGSLDSTSMTSSSKQTQESVPMYDPVPDAKALKAALTTPNRADAKPLITLLPYLTPDEMHALRSEYRNTMRMSGRAVNLAKHIGARLTGSFGKACHSTALGQWESEAYWIILHRDNPQRKELLIETLVGRPNAEIEKIKTSFRENYNQDLEKCVKTELKPDKFRMAMLVALAEARMPDNAPIDPELVREDVRGLRRALSEENEMDMLQIVLVRGYAHLREVLHVYKSAFRENFAREMINRSRNVVVSTSPITD